MKGRVKFEIDNSEPGAIRYREGWKEYKFPVFEDNGETVFVAEPTLQRLFLFLWSGGWTWVPTQLETAERERITQRVSEYLSRKGARVRVMSRDCSEVGCQFHPELFEARSKAVDVLEQAGFSSLQDYESIDLLHADYGLEVCGHRGGTERRAHSGGPARCISPMALWA